MYPRTLNFALWVTYQQASYLAGWISSVPSASHNTPIKTILVISCHLRLGPPYSLVLPVSPGITVQSQPPCLLYVPPTSCVTKSTSYEIPFYTARSSLCRLQHSHTHCEVRTVLCLHSHPVGHSCKCSNLGQVAMFLTLVGTYPVRTSDRRLLFWRIFVVFFNCGVVHCTM